VKWLVRISALERPFEGHYQTEKYVYKGDAAAPEGAPVSLMRVRAAIARPADGSEVGSGPVEVTGSAWSGTGPVARVEVSSDGGGAWAAATLGRSASPVAAVPWRFVWSPSEPGGHTLVARATDAAGHVQPLEPVWNEQGYGNNVAQRVRVRVVPGA
jgi:hypothetical protein